MSISAETYIVISLMFAVFAAVAAVGTSVVLGAGFERLRAGFEIVRRQSGFFSDAIYKLDQRTEKLAEETAKLKSGLTGMGDRVERVEKRRPSSPIPSTPSNRAFCRARQCRQGSPNLFACSL